MQILKTEEKNKIDKKKVSKEIDKKVSNKIFINLLTAITIMIYFCSMSVVYKNTSLTQIVDVVKVATLVFLAITLVLIEIAYKKESKRVFIHCLEALLLAVHSLTTMHIIKVYDFDFQNYILASSYLFSVYYVLKTIIISTKAKSDYLKGLSDISEIVQKDEPSKKEASKKVKEDINEKEENIKEANEKKKEKKIEKQIKKIKEEQTENKLKKDNNEKNETKTIEKNNKKETLEKQIAETKSKIASIRAKLEKIQTKNETVQEKNKESKAKQEEQVQEKTVQKEKVKKEPAQKLQEEPAHKEPVQEESITEEAKPKRKRGRPKKEVKIDD